MGTPTPADLIGRWRLTRVIDDRLGPERLDVDGTVELALEADGRVRWHETGTLHRRGEEVPVSRTLFVEPRDDRWFVTFDDGRDFHPWSPGVEVVHDCGADTYTGYVDVTSPDRWNITWTATGPAKDYTMVSELNR